jgi:hypothetical protein
MDLLVFIVGVFLVSRALNEQVYNAINSWVLLLPPDT